jgi:Flp pilus assembly protein TadD
MNTDLNGIIQDALKPKLLAEGFDFDIVPISTQAHPAVTLQAIEEALSAGAATGGFLIQIRPEALRPAKVSAQNQASLEADSEDDQEIHLPDGRLNTEFLLRNARLLFHSSEFQLAANIYSTLLRENERPDTASHWLGRCLEAQGKDAEACSLYERSIQFKATLEAYQRLASLHIRRSRDKEAAQTLVRASTLKEVDQSTRYELLKAAGNCWSRADLRKEAEAAYREALKLRGGSDSVLTNLGALLVKEGRLSEAKECFQKAIATNSKNDRAHSGLGSAFYALGEKRQAHDTFARALELRLENSHAIFHLVKCAFELKTYATAARIVGEYIQVAPVNIPLLYSLAGLQYHLGRVDEARATTNQLLQLKPEHAGAKDLKKVLEKLDTVSAQHLN